MKYYQTKNSGNTSWSERLYHGSTSSAPTVTTDSLEMGFAANADLTGTVVSQGSSDLTSYGFVWATNDAPTIADNMVEVGTGSFTGAFSDTIGSLFAYDSQTLYFAAYATNSVGTSYGVTLNGEVMICFAAGTKITTMNGSKNIEHVNYYDDLLVWNFDKARFTTAKPTWIVKPFISQKHSVLTFNDGTTLKTVADGKGHRIFNLKQMKFTYSMSDDTPIGTKTITQNKKVISLVDKYVVKQPATFYNVITHFHMNAFANGVLTSTGLNNLYPIQNMKFVKTPIAPRMRSEFIVPSKLFDGLRLAEQPIDYPDLDRKIKLMMSRQLTL